MMCHQFVCLNDFEKHAVATLPRDTLSFITGGSTERVTLKDNLQAFKRWRLLPRVLMDVSTRDLTTTILGYDLSFPVCVAPVGVHRIAHPDGEIASAQGAADVGTAFSLSTWSSTSPEDVAASSPNGLHFFQAYPLLNRDFMKQLIQRAEKCGYKALILTVDAAAGVLRTSEHGGSAELLLPPHIGLAHFDGPTNLYRDPAFAWEDIGWLKSITSLPIVMKGIMTGDDAEKAVAYGVAGIVVSNHGGRQLDTQPATIDALPEVVRAVKGRCEVYMDGGVRQGTDVLKALALGARAVFLGRPVLYGLTYKGREGVVQVLEILKEELSAAMALSGCRSVQDIKATLVRHESQFQHKL